MAAAVLGLTLVLASTLVLGAATATSAAATGSGRERLSGHQGLVPPGATLVGPAPASTALPLDVTLKPRDPAALAAEVQAVSDPSSPDYRHFLTPAQFAARFGPTRATIAQVTAALHQEGLTVGGPSATGLSLPVSGTVAQVQTAFSTPISKYRLSSGKTGYDNTSAPEVAASVAPEIQGILGLDTLSPPQPSTSVPEASTAAAHPVDATAAAAPTTGQPTPTGTSCTNGINGVATSTGALDAPELAQAYAFDPLYSSSDYGTGSTVALVEMSGAGFSASDIDTFAACYGIYQPPAPGPADDGQITTTSIAGGGATGGGTVEAELDIETVLSLAPQADIDVYEGGASASLYDVFDKIVSDDTAKIVSASWTNGCEAYVGQALQNSENTLFQAAATEGQSVFVASGDQGAQGCNINGEISAATGTDPVAQAVDHTTGTLYIANKSSNTLSVDSEGSTTSPAGFSTAASVSTGTGPDAVALDPTDGKVFVANSGSTLTTFTAASCNQTTTTGCSTPTQIPSGGHLSAPAALAVSGSTLYVGNGNGTVAVYNASSNAYVATVTLPSLSVPTALAVDGTNNVLYVADGTNNRVEYFSTSTCNATTTTGCSAVPATVAVGHDPIALAMAAGAGDLYVANAGSGGGVSVVSLSTHSVVKTISTSQAYNGTGLVQSIGLSPDGTEVMAVLNGLIFPGDVMATISTASESITSTVNLETGTDTMGQLVSDSSLGYVWVTDETSAGDVIQNLNLAVSDPASQPYVTSVGGTSFGHGTRSPLPPEQAWNDAQYYSEGAGGGGISTTFTMPGYQQALGTVSGSSGTPCGNTGGGDCREVPDVSADADPSSGYIVYDTVDSETGWIALGGTSAAAPLWAAVLAVVASADGNTIGYGALNPALYQLAQQSPNTYLNDVTTGNNDYNATAAGNYPAMAAYDMATGLGTPVASELADGLTTPLDVAISGSQIYQGSPTFSATPDIDGSSSLPAGVTLDSTALSCTTVGSSTPISSSLAIGGYTLLASSCSGLSLSGPDANGYSIVYTSAANDFTVEPIPVDVAVSGTQAYGGTPSFNGTDNPPSGITVDTSGLTCTQAGASAIAPTTPAGHYTLAPASCSGAILSGSDANYGVVYTSATGDFTVSPVPLTLTASSTSMTYGGAVPAITAGYSGFVNSDSASSLTTAPTCATVATSSSTVGASPYASYCSGAVDPDYTISYLEGSVTVNTAPLTVTASSAVMTFGSAPPTVTPGYTGFVNNDSASSLTTPPGCSTVATGSSSVAGGPYPTSCSGAADPNYTITYVNGTTTVTPAPIVVSVSGSQANQGSPGFAGAATAPSGVTVNTSGLTCGQISPSGAITSALSSGSYTLVAGSCTGVTLSGPEATNYSPTYVSSAGDFSVTGGPVPAPPPPVYGYWLVGSDGGIFTFGSAQFYGSTGSLRLQRPVVGISPTADKGGYWLVASDGGIFAFGDAGYYGSIPGTGLAPAGSGQPHSLNAPIVGMVPSSDGGGYFMVASDGGVFAFGDARFEGSCPGIGGCSGAAVSVVPDASGNGYWLVTQTGHLYAFGDAPFYGAPGNVGSPVTSAVRTADGHGYWVLLANGTVDAYGDAVARGGPLGSVGGLDPASAIYADADGGGYWVASAAGAVFSYGDAPNDGSMVGNHLNGSIIAASGF